MKKFTFPITIIVDEKKYENYFGFSATKENLIKETLGYPFEQITDEMREQGCVSINLDIENIVEKVI